ncbi:FixH family protein [Rapidithrix thailandica]|uniref:FixH family protein n=1 Tax=Rapidithrix thailandica TaxID=413964 RepID=A0AAW9RZQ4_9BACT
MKFNWGHGITLAFIIVCSTFLTAVYQTTNHPHHLMVENYYEKELVYDEQMEKVRNVQELGVKPTLQYDTSMQAILVNIPGGTGEGGKITFLRPSNPQWDFEIALGNSGQTLQSVQARKVQSGMWKVMIEWTKDGKAFYDEQTFVKP